MRLRSRIDGSIDPRGWLLRPALNSPTWSSAGSLGLLATLAVTLGVIATAAPRLTLGSVCIAVIGIFLFQLLTSAISEARSLLLQIVLLAAVIRLTVAVATYNLLPYGYFAPDEIGYSSTGNDLAVIGLPNPIDVVRDAQGWFFINGILASFFGADAPLLARLWNCCVGSLLPVLCYPPRHSHWRRDDRSASSGFHGVFSQSCPMVGAELKGR